MSLEQVISDIKSGRDFLDFVDEVDLNILGNIQCELSQTGTRREIFDMASGLSDPIIEWYLLMDESSKVKMEELYELERNAFEKVGGINAQKRKKLLENYVDEEIFILRQITNYDKIKLILEQYCEDMESIQNPNISEIPFGKNYLKKNGNEGLECNDFENDVRTKSVSNDKVLRSFTYGVSEKLKQRVEDVHSLLPHRINFLENYCKEVISIKNPNPTELQLGHLFLSKKGVGSWSSIDFAKRVKLKKMRLQDILKSLTYNIPEELKKRVYDLQSLLPHRINFLEQYCDEMLLLKFPKISKVKLGSKYFIKKNLVSWSCYDFENEKTLNSKTNAEIFRSITYGVPQELKQKIHDIQSLLPHRIHFLEEYCNLAETIKDFDIMKVNLNLNFFKKRGVEQWYLYDFKNNVHTGNKKSISEVIKSITYGVPQELKERVYKLNCVKL